ncbi:hypothetical protein C8Q75DRAFT_577127 [Abortiporus biennis]|nr:hypothetical protein C8Q75DRAFT_577127 [Abortiporus biennis]
MISWTSLFLPGNIRSLQTFDEFWGASSMRDLSVLPREVLLPVAISSTCTALLTGWYFMKYFQECRKHLQNPESPSSSTHAMVCTLSMLESLQMMLTVVICISYFSDTNTVTTEGYDFSGLFKLRSVITGLMVLLVQLYLLMVTWAVFSHSYLS